MNNNHIELFYITALKALGKCTVEQLAKKIEAWNPVYASRMKNTDGSSQINDLIESDIIKARHCNAVVDFSASPTVIHYKK